LSEAKPPLELERQRDLATLLRDAFSVYFGHFGAFLLVAAAVAIPVDLIVSGVGLEQLTSGYDAHPPAGETIIPGVVAYLITTPLITAMTVHLLVDTSRGQKPRAREAITSGLEAFTPLFLAILLAALATLAGLIVFLVGAIYVAVKVYFVPQLVVLEKARGPDALRRSWKLTDRSFWRCLGIILVSGILAGLASVPISLPFTALAKSADSQALLLAGQVVTQVLFTPFTVIVATLLYFDLRFRGRTALTQQPPA
jgi:membrane-anchored glycerophosphoryl diester phosphodiesterase (GDPDase)